nr:hypothetical protein [Tanacetum cinerariifolium]GEZ77175.1 hypothetical protein [Tanacetum cinerariifolium]
AHDALLESSSSKPHDESNTQVPKGSGNLNPTASSSNPPADEMETLTSTKEFTEEERSKLRAGASEEAKVIRGSS